MPSGHPGFNARNNAATRSVNLRVDPRKSHSPRYIMLVAGVDPRFVVACWQYEREGPV